MDSNDTGAIALLSVHPRFASALLQGTKKVEFRKIPNQVYYMEICGREIFCFTIIILLDLLILAFILDTMN